MKPEVDTDTQEIFEDMAEDLVKSRKDDFRLRLQKGSYGSGPSGKLILIMGLGAAIIIFLIFLFLRGSGKPDLTPVQRRIDQAENRLALFEGNLKKIAVLESQLKSLQETQAGLVASGKAVSERLDHLAKQVEKARALPEAPKAAAQAKMQVHEVRRGDTLYGITAKYGITLEQLLRLNNLNKNATIQPGQRLLISPGRP
ncbi:MAG: LysM peptidoglycan-binding domain-containing protein [Deltaproteobacteria bacterium]|nr:LysM peptidoglycan-binding domain-containing protein [Deltaproteobacteria bacterium]